MKTAVLFASHYGCTEKCAAKIAGKLAGDTEVFNLDKSGPGALDAYDAVIIGASIRAGRIKKSIRRFCAANLEALKSRRLGLFLCCFAEGDAAERQFAEAFPKDLVDTAVAKGFFGGELNFERMNWLEKTVIKAKLSKANSFVPKIKDEAIDTFIQAMTGADR